MQVFYTIRDVQKYLQTLRLQGRTIGFVPTMGALHQGHLELVKRAKSENHCVVCSVYVNPTQFNNAEDLAKYPRILEADKTLLESIGCDVLFAPNDAEMYPKPSLLRFHFGNLEEVMEGKFRAGHFNGVATIVSKLFHCILPDKAYFGQKDLQQCLIIKRLVEDLSFPLQLVICPIVREANGLAMSSRNRRLSQEEQELATNLFKALQMAENLLPSTPFEQIKEKVASYLGQFPIELEYFEIADGETLQPINTLTKRPIALCIAAFVGGVRLIDNILLQNGFQTF
ncbi:MAG: pantoate--beta-alanine ligase [Raineya sp.]